MNERELKEYIAENRLSAREDDQAYQALVNQVDEVVRESQADRRKEILENVAFVLYQTPVHHAFSTHQIQRFFIDLYLKSLKEE